MEFTREEVRELLDYDPYTGVLIWRERDEKWFSSSRECKRWNTRYAGTLASCLYRTKSGYENCRVKLIGRTYLAHRVIWVWMYGEDLPGSIDHINHDATDNRAFNLRKSSYEENGRNKSMPINNTSGQVGVNWHKSHKKWQAYGKVDGKRTHLGYFKHYENACAAAREFRLSRGFDRTHGEEIAHYHTHKEATS